MNNLNIYCDESCYLEHDRQKIMCIGAVWLPTEEVKSISKDINKIKTKYNALGELKWTKVSRSKIDFYLELVEYFFKNRNLRFRTLVVEDKRLLNHDYFNKGSHDTFYYKMYYYLLKEIIKPGLRHNIYLDIKDTRSYAKIEKLGEIFRNSYQNIDKEIISKIQLIRSHESHILQLTDFLLGATSYYNRNLDTSPSKLSVIEKIIEYSGVKLNKTTPPWEEKFNIFIFHPRTR